MKRYENIEAKLCEELDKLDKKLGSGSADLTPQDLETIDLIYHALKSQEGYFDMKRASEEWEEEEMSMRSGRNGGGGGGRSSYARRRDSMGRFSSREMMPEYSGHFPEWMPPMYSRY